MAFDKTLRVVQPSQRRLKIFIDFWNVVINARSQTKFNIDVDWRALSDRLVQETRQGYTDESMGELAGCYIFGSYAKSDSSSLSFVEKVLDEYGSLPGMFFDFQERIKKETSHRCPNCNSKVPRSSESGVDVLLTVEMIKHAAMRGHDYLALVSSDRDYIPILQYMKDQGQRVIHVAPGEAHREMRSATWKQVEIKNYYPNLCNIRHEKTLILTEPNQAPSLAEATDALDKFEIKYDIVDITDKVQINDRDLSFILNNQRIYFRKPADSSGSSFQTSSRMENIYQLRKDIAQGNLRGNLPYIIVDGRMEAHRDDGWGWISDSNAKFDEIWAQLRQSHKDKEDDF